MTDQVVLGLMELLGAVAEDIFDKEWDTLLDKLLLNVKTRLDHDHPDPTQPDGETYVELHEFLERKITELSNVRGKSGDKAMFIDLWKTLTDQQLDELLAKIIDDKVHAYLAKKSEEEITELNEKIVKHGKKHKFETWFDRELLKFFEKIHKSTSSSTVEKESAKLSTENVKDPVAKDSVAEDSITKDSVKNEPMNVEKEHK